MNPRKVTSDLQLRVQRTVTSWYSQLRFNPRDYTGPINDHFVKSAPAAVQIQARLESWGEDDATLRLLAISEAKRLLAWMDNATRR
jgi:hypothetical protein